MDPVPIPAFQPIGYVTSVFRCKNGTPRQPSVSSTSRGSITVLKDIYTNPDHSLLGLDKFSYVWILFFFHQNGKAFTKAKVQPPRLNGLKVGVFSTRSPHRYNPIGLSLAKIETIDGSTIHLSGIDMVDGTPVLDIKPYIHTHDSPPWHLNPASDHKQTESALLRDCQQPSLRHPESLGHPEHTESFDQPAQYRTEQNETHCEDASYPALDLGPSSIAALTTSKVGVDNNEIINNESLTPVQTDGIQSDVPLQPSWILEPPIPRLSVGFTPRALSQLQAFSPCALEEDYRLTIMTDFNECQKAITDILEADPRSVYRRNECKDSLYYFSVDVVHVTCWFDDSHVEVVKIQPLNRCKYLQTDDHKKEN